MKLPTGNEQMIRLHLLSAQDLINRAKDIKPTGGEIFDRAQKAVREEYLYQASSQLSLAEAYLT